MKHTEWPEVDHSDSLSPHEEVANQIFRNIPWAIHPERTLYSVAIGLSD